MITGPNSHLRFGRITIKDLNMVRGDRLSNGEPSCKDDKGHIAREQVRATAEEVERKFPGVDITLNVASVDVEGPNSSVEARAAVTLTNKLRKLGATFKRQLDTRAVENRSILRPGALMRHLPQPQKEPNKAVAMLPVLAALEIWKSIFAQLHPAAWMGGKAYR